VLDTLHWLNTSLAPRVQACRNAAVSIDVPLHSVGRPAVDSFPYAVAHRATENETVPHRTAKSSEGCAAKAAWNVSKVLPSRPV
jgi:hypothetical protein